MYSELLHATVVEEEQQQLGLPELVAQALNRRRELQSDSGDRHGDAEWRMTSSLTYDAALVALCRRLGLPETLTDGAEVTRARRQAEAMLAERLPALRMSRKRNTE